MPTCPCGGKVLTVYIRQGKPLRWVPLGKMCIQCKTWEGEVYTPDTHQADATPPLDVQGSPPDSTKGKVPISRSVQRRQALQHGQPMPDFSKQASGPPDQGKPLCTCGPGERAKGKHNKKCPARGA